VRSNWRRKGIGLSLFMLPQHAVEECRSHFV
jgi:hypothetical protein